MIWRNFFRDLRRTASRLISVSIITMIAVVVYTGLSGIIYNVDRIMDAYYGTQNVADYWITGVGLDMADCRALEGLDGVTGVQPRVVLDAEERHDSDITLSLYGVPEDQSINTSYVTEGRLPESNQEIFLSDQFAEARGLAVGDWYEITLTGLGIHLRLQVCGVGKNPECLYPINATTPSPDLSRYGFAYVKEEVLSGVMGSHIYNQICITTADDVSAAQIRAEVDDVLGIMSFFEQIRSLATLMVLGFYEGEIKYLQLSENLIFAAVGILLGIPLGIGLDRFLILSITAMPLEVVITARAIALSCGVTMLFALAVNVVIGRKMREIDMLGALKSVE